MTLELCVLFGFQGARRITLDFSLFFDAKIEFSDGLWGGLEAKLAYGVEGAIKWNGFGGGKDMAINETGNGHESFWAKAKGIIYVHSLREDTRKE